MNSKSTVAVGMQGVNQSGAPTRSEVRRQAADEAVRRKLSPTAPAFNDQGKARGQSLEPYGGPPVVVEVHNHLDANRTLDGAIRTDVRRKARR